MAAVTASVEELRDDVTIRDVVVAPELKDMEATYGQNDYADKVRVLDIPHLWLPLCACAVDVHGPSSQNGRECSGWWRRTLRCTRVCELFILSVCVCVDVSLLV